MPAILSRLIAAFRIGNLAKIHPGIPVPPLSGKNSAKQLVQR